MKLAYRDTMPIDRIKEIINYDPATGVFTWKAKTRHNMPAIGTQAGGIRNTHYYIRIDKVDYLASRIAWVITYGEVPSSRVAFKDSDPLNLKIENLFLQRTLIKKHDVSTFDGRTAYMTEYNSMTVEQRKNKALLRSFKITLREYEAMLVAQGGKCAVCNKEETAKRFGKDIAMAVDHDHATGEVRALLCRGCNQGLGNFKENIEFLQNAIAYLQKHKEKKHVASNVIPLNSGVK